MVSATDGSAFTDAVTVYVTGDNGTQATGTVGSGVCTHEGNGYHSYAPAQAETNYDHVAFTFIGSGAVPQTVQVYTSTTPTAGQNAAALLDLADAIETGLTLREALRLIAAALAGKISGAATTTVTIRNAIADSKDRIIATVDSSGDRTAITTDVS